MDQARNTRWILSRERGASSMILMPCMKMLMKQFLSRQRQVKVLGHSNELTNSFIHPFVLFAMGPAYDRNF